MLTWPEVTSLLRAALENTVSLLSGFFGLIVSAIGFFMPHVPARWAWQTVGLLALFYAVILAWRDEHRKGEKESEGLRKEIQALQDELKTLQGKFDKLNTLDFEGEIEAVYHAKTRWEEIEVLVVVRVANPRGPARAVMDWRMEIETKVRTYAGQVQGLLKKEKWVYEPEGERSFLSQDYAPDKMTQPIAVDGISSGWFWSVFPDVRTLGKLHDEVAMVVVSFCDVRTGKRHYLRRHLTEEDHIRAQMTKIEKRR
jgi:membrane protein implicated in regulation of membrane protease activity